MPRTSFRSSIESDVTSAVVMVRLAKSNVSQVFTAAYSSCACATEKAEHRTSNSSGRDNRAKLKGDFIRSFLCVAMQNEALPHGRATAPEPACASGRYLAKNVTHFVGDVLVFQVPGLDLFQLLQKFSLFASQHRRRHD